MRPYPISRPFSRYESLAAGTPGFGPITPSGSPSQTIEQLQMKPLGDFTWSVDNIIGQLSLLLEWVAAPPANPWLASCQMQIFVNGSLASQGDLILTQRSIVSGPEYHHTFTAGTPLAAPYAGISALDEISVGWVVETEDTSGAQYIVFVDARSVSWVELRGAEERR